LKKHFHVDPEESKITASPVFQRLSRFFATVQDMLIWLFQFLSTRQRLDAMLIIEKEEYEIVYNHSMTSRSKDASSIAAPESAEMKDLRHKIQAMQRSLRLTWAEIAMMTDVDQVVRLAPAIRCVYLGSHFNIPKCKRRTNPHVFDLL
jgi:hypothetical protein